MFLVGLSGGIASGKSTVTKLLENEFGCPCIDADLIARQVVEPGQKAHKKIREKFGDELFHEDGQLNREKLGQIIFHDPDKRRLLNAIVHPAIKWQMLWQTFQYFIKGHQFVILDIPLLFETKQMLPYLSYTVVIYCHEEQQLDRLVARNSLSIEDAKARIQAQLPLSEKCKMCTYTIDNTGSREETRDQVTNIYHKLRSSKKHWIVRFGLLTLLVAMLFGCRMIL